MAVRRTITDSARQADVHGQAFGGFGLLTSRAQMLRVVVLDRACTGGARTLGGQFGNR